MYSAHMLFLRILTTTYEEVLLFCLCYICRNKNISRLISRKHFIYAAICLMQNYIYLVLV